MTDQPLVSVLMTCYNHETYVAEAIESCLKQDYENLEIVVADDCSKDQSADIIQGLVDSYPAKIKFLRNPKNLGLTKNLNHALCHCTGKYIVFISADDVFLAGKITKQVAHMESDPNLAISYHDVQVFRESDARVLYNISERYKPLSGGLEIMLEGGIFFSCLGCMVRRSSVPTAGYDENIKLCSDWFFMAETLIASGLKMCYTPGIYALHRRHDNNITDAYKNRLIDEEREAIAQLAYKYPALRPQLSNKANHLDAMKIVKLLSHLEFTEAFSLIRSCPQAINTILVCMRIAAREVIWRVQTLKYSVTKLKRLSSSGNRL